MNFAITVLLTVVVFLCGFNVSKSFYSDRIFNMETEVQWESKANPTKYKDEYSFGYSLGMLRCEKIIRDNK